MNCPYLISKKNLFNNGNDNTFHLIMQTFCCIFTQCDIISKNQIIIYTLRRSFFENHNGI